MYLQMDSGHFAKLFITDHEIIDIVTKKQSQKNILKRNMYVVFLVTKLYCFLMPLFRSPQLINLTQKNDALSHLNHKVMTVLHHDERM